MIKKWIIPGAVIFAIICVIIVIIHVRNNMSTEKSRLEQLADSAAKYRARVVIDSLNLIVSKDKLHSYETDFDTLAKNIAYDSFTAQVKRSVLRARIKADIRAGEIRDSLRRLSVETRSD